MNNTHLLLSCIIAVLFAASLSLILASNEYYNDFTETQRSLPILIISFITTLFAVYQLALNFTTKNIHNMLIFSGLACFFISLGLSIVMISAKLDYATYVTFTQAYLPSFVGIILLIVHFAVAFILRCLYGDNLNYHKAD